MAGKWITFIMVARERKIYFPFVWILSMQQRRMEKAARKIFAATKHEQTDPPFLFPRRDILSERAAFIHGITSVRAN